MKKFRFASIFLAALLQGAYMLFDGIHKMRTGVYFGKRIGPWSHIVSALGISVDSMGPVFAVLGALWIAALVIFLLRLAWSRWMLTALAILTLGYIPFGTLLSCVVLLMLALAPQGRLERSQGVSP
jgi:hypothetical protein